MEASGEGGKERKKKKKRSQKRGRRRLEVIKSMDMKQDIKKKTQSKTDLHQGGWMGLGRRGQSSFVTGDRAGSRENSSKGVGS